MGGCFRSCGCGGSSKPYSPYGYAEGPVPIYAPPPAPVTTQFTETTYTTPTTIQQYSAPAPVVYTPPPPVYNPPPPPPPVYTGPAFSGSISGPPPQYISGPPQLGPPPLGPPPLGPPPGAFGPPPGAFAQSTTLSTSIPPPNVTQSPYYHQANILPGAPPPGPYNTTPPVIKY